MITVTDAHTGVVIARHPAPVDEAGALRAELLSAYHAIEALAERLRNSALLMRARAVCPWEVSEVLIAHADVQAQQAVRRRASLQPRVEAGR